MTPQALSNSYIQFPYAPKATASSVWTQFQLPLPQAHSNVSYLNTDYIHWDSYKLPTHLSIGQRLFIGLIKDFYQPHTRGNKREKLLGRYLRWAFRLNRHPQCCAFQCHEQLSCSEFGVVAIAQLGTFRGLWAIFNRIALREPLALQFEKYPDDKLFLQAIIKKYSIWRNSTLGSFHDPVYKIRLREDTATKSDTLF